MRNFDCTNAAELEETRHRLRQWGKWCEAILSMGLHFSSKTIIGQLVDSKGVMIRSTCERLTPENDEAEEIDNLIIELAKEDSKKARVLYYHYTTHDKFSQKVKRSACSKGSYIHHLAQGEKWINERL